MAQLLMNFDKVNGRLLQSIILLITRSLLTLTHSDLILRIKKRVKDNPNNPPPPKKKWINEIPPPHSKKIYELYHSLTLISLQLQSS